MARTDLAGSGSANVEEIETLTDTWEIPKDLYIIHRCSAEHGCTPQRMAMQAAAILLYSILIGEEYQAVILPAKEDLNWKT